MHRIIFISGPCGSGKTTFANALARHLVRKNHKTVYVVHGDDFQDGFVEPEDKGCFFEDGLPSDRFVWEDILRFNWSCIIDTAAKALEQGLDVLIDYVIEDELPRVRKLAAAFQADLSYIVLTASGSEIERRIRGRGDTDLIERALFLKSRLEAMPENQGHIYDNTGKATEDMLREIDPDRYLFLPAFPHTERMMFESGKKEKRMIETERLILREYTPDDFDALYEIVSDPETMAHYPAPFDEERTRRWIEWNLENYGQYGFGLWAVVLKETGEFIGDCGLTLQNIDGELLPEIGYHIHKKYWRRGFAKEAARAVRDWAFLNTEYNVLYSYMKYTNVGSWRTAMASGMKKVKEYPDPKNTLSYAFAVTRQEWEQSIPYRGGKK